MSSIPIDPALLTEDELRAGMARLEAFPPSDEEDESDIDDDEVGDGPANGGSSGIESDSEDAYVDSEEEEARAGGSRRAGPAPRNDAVFK